MPDPATIIVAIPTMLVSATVVSSVGFGMGIVSSPLLLIFMDPQDVVVLINTVSLPLFGLIILQNFRCVQFRDAFIMAAAGAAGVPIGLLILNSSSDSFLRVFMALLIIFITLSLRSNLPTMLVRYKLTGPAIGLLIGTLLASTGIGGPLVAIYLITRYSQKQIIRTHLAIFFLVVQGISVLGYAATGLIQRELLIMLVITAIPIFLGNRIGTWLVTRISDTKFRQGTMGVILLTSFTLLAREATNLLF